MCFCRRELREINPVEQIGRIDKYTVLLPMERTINTSKRFRGFVRVKLQSIFVAFTKPQYKFPAIPEFAQARISRHGVQSLEMFILFFLFFFFTNRRTVSFQRGSRQRQREISRRANWCLRLRDAIAKKRNKTGYVIQIIPSGTKNKLEHECTFGEYVRRFINTTLVFVVVDVAQFFFLFTSLCSCRHLQDYCCATGGESEILMRKLLPSLTR